MEATLPLEGERDQGMAAALVSPHVVELLCSRLCHDLISPVGAVKSGLELLAEFDDDPGGEAMALINNSADSASLKLRFFRVAFGLAGTTQSDLSLAEGKLLADAMVASARTTLAWPGSEDATARPAPGIVKAALNIILIAADAMPRGGTITARVMEGPGKTAIAVEAAAGDARLSDEMRAAIAGDAADDALTPRTVQAYFTAMLLRRAGAALEVVQEADRGFSFRTEIGHAG